VFKIPKESLYPQCGVYIEKSVGGENVSVAWHQLKGLMQVVGWRKSVVDSIDGQRHSMIEGILTCVTARHRKTLR
jgi:hypothetical protein